jgi:hypothetical protein
MILGDRTRRSVLTPAMIRHALERLAEILDADGVAAQITVYGGASLAIAYFENDRTATATATATADVDGTHHPVREVEAAADLVATKLGLTEGWLNNRMQMFLPPDGTDDSLAFLERGHVRICVGSAATLLALKLRASRPGRDFEDIAVLVHACGHTTVAECEAIVNDFYLGEEEIPARGYQLLERAFGEVRVVNADPPFVLPAVTNHS